MDGILGLVDTKYTKYTFPKRGKDKEGRMKMKPCPYP